MVKLKDGEFYWLYSKAIDTEVPLMIGICVINGIDYKWLINGNFYTAGNGIDVIKHISRPKLIK